MFRLFIVVSLLICVGLIGNVAAQDAAQKTKDLVAALDKTKYKKKEKKNVSVEVFVDVKNEAVVKVDLTEYSGRYETEGYQLLLTVGKDGKVTGSGYDSFANSDKPTSFQLKDGRVDGALLTGTKVYDNGMEAALEAVFVNRTSRTGTNPNSINESSTKFGVGFIQNDSAGSPGNSGWTNRVFLDRR